jgi:peptide chain release factor 3
VNKCDRIGVPPLQLLDDVESELGIRCSPITWPVSDGTNFLGVYDRGNAGSHLFEKGGDHGQTELAEDVAGIDDPKVGELLGSTAKKLLSEEIELLDAAGEPFDPAPPAEG